MSAACGRSSACATVLRTSTGATSRAGVAARGHGRRPVSVRCRPRGLPESWHPTSHVSPRLGLNEGGRDANNYSLCNEKNNSRIIDGVQRRRQQLGTFSVGQ
jgi:hypothetical protein